MPVESTQRFANFSSVKMIKPVIQHYPFESYSVENKHNVIFNWKAHVLLIGNHLLQC